jgi:hypothetical protein
MQQKKGNIVWQSLDDFMEKKHDIIVAKRNHGEKNAISQLLGDHTEKKQNI